MRKIFDALLVLIVGRKHEPKPRHWAVDYSGNFIARSEVLCDANLDTWQVKPETVIK